MPKRCHSCKAVDHLIADCPYQTKEAAINKPVKNPRKKSDRQKSRPKSNPEDGNTDEEKTTVSPNLNGDEISVQTEREN